MSFAVVLGLGPLKLPATIVLYRFTVPWARRPPPSPLPLLSLSERLLVMVTLERLTAQPPNKVTMKTPPPSPTALLPLMVLFVTVTWLAPGSAVQRYKA